NYANKYPGPRQAGGCKIQPWQFCQTSIKHCVVREAEEHLPCRRRIKTSRCSWIGKNCTQIGFVANHRWQQGSGSKCGVHHNTLARERITTAPTMMPTVSGTNIDGATAVIIANRIANQAAAGNDMAA